MEYNLSADKKYYSSGDVSALTGRRPPKPVTTQKVVRKVNPSPGAESTDKYYANDAGQTVVSVPAMESRRAETESISDVSDIGKVIDAVVDAFSIGATEVSVPVMEDFATKARTNLDLRVGRSEITKDQADSVSFVVLQPAEPEPAAVVQEEPEVVPPEEEAVVEEEAVAEEEAVEEEVEEELDEESPSIASLFGADDDDDDGDE